MVNLTFETLNGTRFAVKSNGKRFVVALGYVQVMRIIIPTCPLCGRQHEHGISPDFFSERFMIRANHCHYGHFNQAAQAEWRNQHPEVVQYQNAEYLIMERKNV